MKKSLKAILTAGALALTLGLTACGSVSEGYAKKINDAAKSESKDDDFTYEKVVKDLGDPMVDVTVAGLGVKETGAATWAKGCKTTDDVEKKLDGGKSVDYIVVEFLNGYAVSAQFGTYTPEDNK